MFSSITFWVESFSIASYQYTHYLFPSQGSNCSLVENIYLKPIWLCTWRPSSFLYPCFYSVISLSTCFYVLVFLLDSFWVCEVSYSKVPKVQSRPLKWAPKSLVRFCLGMSYIFGNRSLKMALPVSILNKENLKQSFVLQNRPGRALMSKHNILLPPGRKRHMRTP